VNAPLQSIDRLFRDLRAAGRKALIPFLTAGDPSLEATGWLIDEVVRRGASLVEIGFPYSDPIADGPVIQASYTRALQRGLHVDEIFMAAAAWTKKHAAVPFVAMLSYSLIHRRGPEKFLDLAKGAGFSGLIVPDLPVDEAEPLRAAAASRDLKLIQLVTPTTPSDRALRIAEQSSGFLYYVSVTGITGARENLPAELQSQLAWLRARTALPICVGFGISKPEHVRLLHGACDGVIVGSAIVRHVEQASIRPLAEVVSDVGALVQSLCGALDER
jgi:tryptophan synthase alpha chain